MRNLVKKTIVALDVSTMGSGGGPYVNSIRLMESDLKNKYDFKKITYRAKIGSGISIRRIFDLRRQLVKINPDIVHFSGLQLSGFHISVACRLANISNLILTVHGFSGDAIYLTSLKKFVLTYFLEPITLLLTKRVYGVSEYVISRRIIRLFKYKCDGFIYNFPPAPYRSQNGGNIRQELSLLDSDILVVSVGRIVKDKGYHVLDEAILEMEIHSGLKFVIVGNGDYLETMNQKLKKQILNKQVFILGHRNDIQRILNGCDIFILPTLHETLSIALLEASVEGLAIAASNTGGVPEIVKNNYSGLLFHPGSVAGVVKTIQKLIYDDDLRNQLGESAKMQINKTFSKKDIEQKVDAVYTMVLNNY